MKQATATLFLWTTVLLALQQAARNSLLLEMTVLLSGIVAVVFAGLLALLLYLLRDGSDWVVLLRGGLWLLLYLSPAVWALAYLGISPLFVLPVGAGLLWWRWDLWQARWEESPRLEPIAFLVLAQKIVFVGFLLLSAAI